MNKIRHSLLLLFVIALMISCGKTNNNDPKSLFLEVTKNQTPNTLTNKEKKYGWLLLFDGKTTDGWHGYNMKVFPDCWKIEDGSLTMNSTGSKEDQDIITNRKYRDFVISSNINLPKLQTAE